MIEHNEMVATLVDVSERLRSLNVNYMVMGSFAMSAYVTARTTMDIDIVLEINAGDATRFERRFSGDCYVAAPSIVQASERLSMFNIINNRRLLRSIALSKNTTGLRSRDLADGDGQRSVRRNFGLLVRRTLYYRN